MLENYKLVFDDLPWFEAGDGMRYKRIQQGDTQLRLVEWDRAMVHANWCFKGHIGYVIEGEVEIDIAGKVGESVLSASDGKVVYAGNSLRGYGNLVIVKHDNTYLTAYAHNSKLLVKEGDPVRKGQKIAEMGDTDTTSIKLHFELRVNGKPVNPIPYLQ